ncbi:MAG: hypothetical protein BAJALOKI3v1_640011 [Promethearchaeota archaeon]|nr:MAG: hypothetical protein BAJALOKI3v1_640011 [Candidatus Lokiarchaeota archaeon]
MDTEYDFLTPEFLHLIFFKQKNIVIFPHVDLKHLRVLEAFTVGYNLIDLEATALYNIREMVRSDAESYSQTPNYHLIYNLDKEKAKQLLDLENAHMILNVNQNCSDLIDFAHESFIFYNKKSAKFLNYEFTQTDLKMEKIILSLAKTYEMIREKLQGIKSTATKIYSTLMNNPESFDIDRLINAYTLTEQESLIEFTENYYDIIIPDDDGIENEQEKDSISRESRAYGNTNQNREESIPKSMGMATRALDFSDDFEIIKNQNKHIFRVFLHELDEYRQKEINNSNLDLNQFFVPNDLYNYLRRHHWSEGIPESFLNQWKAALNRNGGLSQEELLDFENILRGLDIKNDLIHQIIDGSESKIQKINERSNNNALPSQLNENDQNLGDYEIPPVSDFARFKAWMINTLDAIEKKLKNST